MNLDISLLPASTEDVLVSFSVLDLEREHALFNALFDLVQREGVPCPSEGLLCHMANNELIGSRSFARQSTDSYGTPIRSLSARQILGAMKAHPPLVPVNRAVRAYLKALGPDSTIWLFLS